MGTKTSAMRAPLALVAATILAATMALAIGLSIGTGKAWAGSTPSIEDLRVKTYTLSYKGIDLDVGYRSFSSTKAPKKAITKAKSSNKKVATVKVGKSGGMYYLRVNLKAAGKSKISFTHNGKKYACTFVVKNYVNPVKSLMIGESDYAVLFDLDRMKYRSGFGIEADVLLRNLNGKVSVKPAGGWKVGKVVSVTYKNKKPMKTIKNGATVKDANSVQVQMVNKKTKAIEWLNLYARGISYRAA